MIDIAETQIQQMGFGTSALTGTTPSANNAGTLLGKIVTGTLAVTQGLGKIAAQDRAIDAQTSNILRRDKQNELKKWANENFKDIENPTSDEILNYKAQIKSTIDNNNFVDKDRLVLEDLYETAETARLKALNGEVLAYGTKVLLNHIGTYESLEEMEQEAKGLGISSAGAIKSYAATLDGYAESKDLDALSTKEMDKMFPNWRFIKDSTLGEKFKGKHNEAEAREGTLAKMLIGESITEAAVSNGLSKDKAKSILSGQLSRMVKDGQIDDAIKLASHQNVRIDEFDNLAVKIMGTASTDMEGAKQAYFTYKNVADKYTFKDTKTIDLIDDALAFLGHEVSPRGDGSKIRDAVDLINATSNNQFPNISGVEINGMLVEKSGMFESLGDIDMSASSFLVPKVRSFMRFTNNAEAAVDLAIKAYDKEIVGDRTTAPMRSIVGSGDDAEQRVDNLIEFLIPSGDVDNGSIDFVGGGRYMVQDASQGYSRIYTLNEMKQEASNLRLFEKAVSDIDNAFDKKKLPETIENYDAIALRKTIDTEIQAYQKKHNIKFTGAQSASARNKIKEHLLGNLKRVRELEVNKNAPSDPYSATIQMTTGTYGEDEIQDISRNPPDFSFSVNNDLPEEDKKKLFHDAIFTYGRTYAEQLKREYPMATDSEVQEAVYKHINKINQGSPYGR